MRKILCRLFSHDRMVTGERKRVCVRENLRQFGRISRWEEVTPVAVRSSGT
jgi:hypothetical protein